MIRLEICECGIPTHRFLLPTFEPRHFCLFLIRPMMVRYQSFWLRRAKVCKLFAHRGNKPMGEPRAKRDPPTTRPSLLIRIRDARDWQAWEEFVDLYGPLIYQF